MKVPSESPLDSQQFRLKVPGVLRLAPFWSRLCVSAFPLLFGSELVAGIRMACSRHSLKMLQKCSYKACQPRGRIGRGKQAI